MSTTDILVARGTRLAAGAGALTTVVALGAALLAAAPAQATPAKPKPYGIVTAKGGVNERQYPSTDSSVEGHLGHRAHVGLVCKVRAQNVMGNTVWFLTRDGVRGGRYPTWVSAKFVTNSGAVKYCKDLSRSHMEPIDPAKPGNG
ncbi:SH3 domain-containing protein [Streptomyces piniterrae]|uniref:SH3 domain-containing protein n=1 Tax=Streptomyces piniterrae TaxID=2571125 RepID=A0A4U0MSV0_9ACTN|nr:SH3 domain-containing protein [Streptomyces piniterrae]TJZ44031.1 SH3 domain-containing protein [Streptomyces piniterrae]